MRKIFFLSIAVSSVPFAFYKLQGPFIIQAQPTVPLGQPLIKGNINLQEQATWHTPDNPLEYRCGPYDIPVLVDPITNFYIMTTSLAHNLVSSSTTKTNFIFLNPQDNVEQINFPDQKDFIYDFLTCNFKYNPENFWKLKNLTQYESITSGRNLGPLICGRTQYKDKKYTKNVQKCLNILCNKGFLSEQTYKIPVEELKNFINYYSYNTFLKYPSLSKHSEIFPNTLPCYTNPIRLRRKFTSASGKIDIINQKDGVKLYKKDQHGKYIREIDLKQALLNYYNHEHYIQTEFAHRLTKDKLKLKKFNIQADTMAWAATQFDHPKLQPKDYELLINSTILTVWDIRWDLFKPKRVFSQEEKTQSLLYDKTIQSVIFGLARDNRTGQLFHWVTDLERDIEVFFLLETLKKIDLRPSSNPQSVQTKNKDVQTDTLDSHTSFDQETQTEEISENPSHKNEGLLNWISDVAKGTQELFSLVIEDFLQPNQE